MTSDEFKQYVKDFVNSHQGCKMIEVASDISSHLPTVRHINDVREVLDGLVATREIVEVEYIIPEMPYRAKSFYLPANTEVNILGGNA